MVIFRPLNSFRHTNLNNVKSFQLDMNQQMPDQNKTYWEFLNAMFAKAEQMSLEYNEPEIEAYQLSQLEILRADDSKEELVFFRAMFHEMLSLFTQPFHGEEFDFSDAEFFGKISEFGDLIWEKSFGGDQVDEARAISQMADGNYLVVGDTRSSNLDISQNNGAADLWVIKISSDGSLLWEKTLGGSNFDVARSISKTQQNDFLIAGSSRSSDGIFINNNGQNDALLLKINSNGYLQWQKTIGGPEIDFFYGAEELTDGSIVAVGDSNSSNEDILENKGFTDLLILKLQ